MKKSKLLTNKGVFLTVGIEENEAVIMLQPGDRSTVFDRNKLKRLICTENYVIVIVEKDLRG